MTSRDRRRERTRREIARAGVDLFRRQGFADTTVEEIVEAADYSVSTFFRMFARKEDVVFFDLGGRLDLATVEVAEAADTGVWADIRGALLRHAASWEGDDPAFAVDRTRLFHTEPALTSRYLEHCARWESDLAARIAARRGSGPDDEVLAFVAAGAVVNAYRAAFRAQARDGGPLTGHLERVLTVIESSGLVRVLMSAGLDARALGSASG